MKIRAKYECEDDGAEEGRKAQGRVIESKREADGDEGLGRVAKPLGKNR